MTITDPDIEVLLPVHNEGASIEATVREIYNELSSRLKVQFIMCEDGSRDNTKEVLLRLSRSVPMRLILADERKGYSRAVKDGMAVLSAAYLLCLDSDGQCDPTDFWPFWECRGRYGLVIGWRKKRTDSRMRKWMSRIFFHVYQVFFRTPLHDPSCPFVLVDKTVLDSLLPDLGEMQQGFWWEFVARIHRRGYSIREVPVGHRPRAAGKTRVYRLGKLPGIGYRHFVALFRIWRQTRRSHVLPPGAALP